VAKFNHQSAWGRTEGIYRKHPEFATRVVCILCGKEMGATALARGAHGKVHVRKGEATARREYSYDGPRTVYEPAGDRTATEGTEHAD
jgi:hypothetical protein